MNFGTTRHNRSAFASFTTTENDKKQVFMRDLRPSPMIWRGKVIFKLTSNEVFVISVILHMLDIY